MLWLDAKDGVSVQHSAGKVSEWLDRSGHSNNARQTDADRRPVFSHNALHFDGSDDYMTVPLTSGLRLEVPVCSQGPPGPSVRDRVVVSGFFFCCFGAHAPRTAEG